MSDYEINLQNHLHKCELEYAAKHHPGLVEIPWLADRCDTVEHIADLLRSLGFRIKDIVDDVDCSGERLQLVRTTSGVVVYANDKYGYGLVGPGRDKATYN